MNYKYYIFFVHTIRNVAGMQLYVSRKIEYLKSTGWIPLIYYYNTGDIKIPNLKQFENNCIPLLRFCVGNVSKKKRTKVLQQIGKDINEYKEIIIETTNLTLGTWGEYVASIYSCKHILYVIDEFISSPTKLMKDFINFKIKQNLLFCINEEIIIKHIEVSQDNYAIQLNAVGSTANNVIEYEHPQINSIPEGGNTILSIGRLDKPYITNLFQSVAEFARQYPDKTFNFLIVGATESKATLKKLLNILSDIENITIYNIGPLWPIPTDLFRKTDVALGSAGSISICSRQGIPSISIDFNDHEAIGILRVNTQNSTFRDSNDPNKSIVYWLKYILIERKEGKLSQIAEAPLNYQEHQHIIDNDYKKEYFPTHTSINLTRHPRIRNVLIRIDQSYIGHLIISFFMSKSIIKKLIFRFNNSIHN